MKINLKSFTDTIKKRTGYVEKKQALKDLSQGMLPKNAQNLRDKQAKLKEAKDQFNLSRKYKNSKTVIIPSQPGALYKAEEEVKRARRKLIGQ
jgi:hypothetical protein